MSKKEETEIKPLQSSQSSKPMASIDKNLAPTVERPWKDEYALPSYWDKRSPLWLGMPKIVNLYLDLNDNKIRKFIKQFEGLILDAGCGDGRFINYADVGVDFSRDMLRRAKCKTNKPLVRADIRKLPFKDNTFSHAIMVAVSLHIKDRKQLFCELYRVSENVHDFLGHSVFPIVFNLMRQIQIRPRRLKAVIALILSFPLDRSKGLSQANVE